ncbi:MAG: DUF3419 family protein [Rhodobacteraceae bacterium]|nr:DUF3419 family protein [Paracoccaceae bacterium]
MTNSEIEAKAAFDHIRYAQLWEDADILTAAMGDCSGRTLVSICAAGDNALAMLVLDPAKIVVVDLSPAQIACLKLRIAAYSTLTHAEFLELMGARASMQRKALLARVVAALDPETQAFWNAQATDVARFGAGGVGKFERYFRIFRTWFLPLVHSRATRDAIFVPRNRQGRQDFFDTRFNTWRWRVLLNVFFSRFVMGRMGRDKAFFDHVDGSPAQHVARRIHHAAAQTDPSENPYLHWIIKGTHGAALPMAWRAENFDVIRDRCARIEIRPGSLEAFIKTGELAHGFNLSDIFEYMSPPVFAQVYDSILGAAAPGARLVYWNMMAPRRVPAHLSARVTRLRALEDDLKSRDKAFFYSDFVIEEVVG